MTQVLSYLIKGTLTIEKMYEESCHSILVARGGWMITCFDLGVSEFRSPGASMHRSLPMMVRCLREDPRCWCFGAGWWWYIVGGRILDVDASELADDGTLSAEWSSISMPTGRSLAMISAMLESAMESPPTTRRRPNPCPAQSLPTYSVKTNLKQNKHNQ